MGLDAFCGSVSGRLGSYGWYHSFRSTVCIELEGGQWASRFPLLQDHSDCEGEYSKANAEGLLQEVKAIEKELRKVQYPAIDHGNQKYRYSYKYGEFGDFAFSNGKKFGVNENGIFVFAIDKYADRLQDWEKEIFDKYGKETTSKSIIGGDSGKIIYFNEATMQDDGRYKIVLGKQSNQSKARYEKIEKDVSIELSILLELPCENSKTLKFSYRPAYEVFKHTINLLKKLAEESMKIGEPIQFC